MEGVFSSVEWSEWSGRVGSGVGLSAVASLYINADSG